MAESSQEPLENSRPRARRTEAGIAEVLRQWRENHASPPSLLYHYTTAEGLLGIVKDSRLWASDVRFTNDPSEMRYAAGIIRSAVEGVRQRDVSNSVDRKDTVEHIMKMIQNPVSSFFDELKSDLRGANIDSVNELTSAILETFDRDIGVYMVCFCGEGDLLSQWRGYGSKGGGYAAGFLANNLVRRAESSGGRLLLRKVVYDPDEQRRILNNGIREFESLLEENDRAIENARLNSETNQAATTREERLEVARRHVLEELQSSVDRMAPQRGDFMEFLLECLLCFKDRAFSAEEEWRLIQLSHGTLDVKFRVKNGQITPYIELDLSLRNGESQGRLPIERIVHGPTLDPEMTPKAIDRLLRSRGYTNVEVRASGIPLRE